jgi:RNA polymerase sigma-70 factor (ECF subfamily)
MGLPLGTVKSRINRGRLQLARFLKEKKEGDHEM